MFLLRIKLNISLEPRDLTFIPGCGMCLKWISWQILEVSPTLQAIQLFNSMVAANIEVPEGSRINEIKQRFFKVNEEWVMGIWTSLPCETDAGSSQTTLQGAVSWGLAPQELIILSWLFYHIWFIFFSDLIMFNYTFYFKLIWKCVKYSFLKSVFI